MTSKSQPVSRVARIVALLGCLVLLTAWRFGPPVPFFEADGGLARAIEKLGDAGGFERVLSIDIVGTLVQIEAQDPVAVGRVNRWTLTKEDFSFIHWDSISGPEPVELHALNSDLDANLFNLAGVDFSAAADLMKEALARAALEGTAEVYRMTIRRQLLLLPKASSGDVVWAVHVRSGREAARLLADGKGRITGIDLDDTARGQAFNLLASLDRMPEAAGAFAQAVGSDPLLVKVDISRREVRFETNLEEKNAVFGSLKHRQVYRWSLNGLQRGMGSLDSGAYFGAEPAFAVGDVDWTMAAKLVAQAKDALQMPDGALDEIEIEKPKDEPVPRTEWQITLKDASGEEGTARFDAKSGDVLGLKLPESRRKPFDARDPALWPSLLAKIEQTFGADGSIAELLINESQISITAADPLNPKQLAQFLLGDEGVTRFGTASLFAEENPRFTVAEIRALTGEQMRKLIDATTARLGLPATLIDNITIGKASMDPSPQGNVTIEIRAGEGPFKRSGRVNWEIDGREIKAYLP